MKKQKVIIIGKPIKIKGSIFRHKIVRKVVNAFIATEYNRKGKGVIFKYPVEDLKDKQQLFIIRPGHKKNFDFKVEVIKKMGLGEGSHKEIALDLRKKGQENQQKTDNLLQAISEVYHCSENDVDRVLGKYPDLKKEFQKGVKVEVILKIIKWLFIMEDIIYWDNEGRAFLYNFLRYVANEKNKERLKDALSKVKDPERLKSFMRKADIEWIPYKIKKQ